MKELIVLESTRYNAQIVRLTKHISEEHEKVCYVTLNKTFNALYDILSKEGINLEQFHFVDLITPRILRQKHYEQCSYIDSLANLSDFADVLLNLIKMHNVEHVIFDSISSFLVYKGDKEVQGFNNYVLSFLEELNVGITLFVLKEDENRGAVKQLEMMADNTRRIEEAW